MTTEHKTEVKEHKKTEIKAEILAMSDIIHKSLTVNKKEGSVTAADDIYEKTLPEGLTMDTVNAVGDHLKTFVPAAAHAFGKSAFEAMKAHKGTERVLTDIHLGKNDKLSLASDRKSVTHPPGDATKEIVTYNRVTVSLDLRAGKSGSQLKAVRSEMNELAMAALSK